MQALQTLRIGQGFDIHQLVDGRPLIIGGVTIPYPKGLLGHSDADVLLHALIDALLGAMGLGDIGRLFPDTDGQWKDVDSRHLVRLVQQKMQALGWEIINIDATIHAEAPKIKPYVAGMIENIAHDLGIDVGQLNIKGKTNEKLGHLGRGEGIAAQVVALLFRRPL